MKQYYKLLYSIYLLNAFSIQAATISPPLTQDEVLNKITLQDRFPHIIHTLEYGRNKVTYNPATSTYSIKFDNEYFHSSVFAINAAGTICAWDAPTGLLEYRSLTVANLVTGKKTTIQENHYGKLTQLCINDAGNQLIGAQSTGILLFLYTIDDIANTFKKYILSHEAASQAGFLGMTPAGNIFATKLPSGQAHVYEINKNGAVSSKSINIIQIPHKQISHMCFTSDDTLVMSGDSILIFTDPLLHHQELIEITISDGQIKNLWRVVDDPNSVIVKIEKEGAQEFRQVTFNNIPYTILPCDGGDFYYKMAWYSNNELVAILPSKTSGTRDIKIWNKAHNYTLQERNTGDVSSLTLSPDNKKMAVYSRQSNIVTVKILDLLTGHEIKKWSFNFSEHFYHITFNWSPDNRFIALTTELPNEEKTDIWDITSGQKIFTTQGKILWFPDDKNMLFFDKNGVRKIDIVTKKEMWLDSLPIRSRNDISISPNGDMIAYKNRNSVEVLDQNFKPVHRQEFKSTYGNIRELAWSADSRYFFVQSDDEQMYKEMLWETSSWKLVNEFRGKDRFSMTKLHFAPNSRLFAAVGLNGMNGTQEIQIWDAVNNKKLETLQGHTRYMAAVSWSPDSTHLATGSFDKTIRVWDLTQFIQQESAKIRT